MLAAAAGGQTVIVDNVDAGFTILSGTWDTGAYGTPYGANYSWATTSGGGGSPAEAEWRPNLPTAGTYDVTIWYVQGANRAVDAPFTVYHAGGSTTVDVNQQTNGETWFSLGAYCFNAGTDGYVRLGTDASAYVVIADAMRFELVSTSTVNLTMAVDPAGAGTVIPAEGGPYASCEGGNQSISASPGTGWQFDHWEVSAGAGAADPGAVNTTVYMDQDKTVTAVFAPAPPDAGEFRAVWIDAFGIGFKSTAEVDAMINNVIAGRYNVILPEVLAFQDTGSSAHGAYWNSSIVPKASDISGSFDPLAYMIQRAHANGIEVHPWLVAFRVSSTWPPAGNPTVAAHPEWIMVPQADMGGGPATVSNYYTLDPGSPEVQNYLASIVVEICSNYAVDGIHWDYIRYTTTDAGYPSDLSYTQSTLARFQELTGYVGTPPYEGEDSWDDFRRMTVTEVVRRAMTEIALIDSAQPIRHSGALVTWYPANTDFTQTRPYYDALSNWRYWLEVGYLDTAIPMAYFDENSYPVTYRAWVDNTVGWAADYGRHAVIGPGIYMNTFADSITQMDYARNAGANGLCTYSYRATNDGGEPWASWYPYVAANLFTAADTVPIMPWRLPQYATKGSVYGRVVDGTTGLPIDHAVVHAGGTATTQTDANGRFLIQNLVAGASGTILEVSAGYDATPNVSRPAVLVERAGMTEVNFAIGPWLSGDYDVDGDVDAADYARFGDCVTGPDAGPIGAGCDLFDFDADADVDTEDFQTFQEAFTG
ncbi:MAG: family 10 glycosylhydrolase [Phycisphaerae bacterium]|nr:family 10 glycosylhydrolase [Phycisphaerae bacterium]